MSEIFHSVKSRRIPTRQLRGLFEGIRRISVGFDRIISYTDAIATATVRGHRFDSSTCSTPVGSAFGYSLASETAMNETVT